MQVEEGNKLSTMNVIQELGVKKLYTGALACFLRDVPFSTIYFPLYAWLKDMMKDSQTKAISPLRLFIAGSIAGNMKAQYWIY